MLKKISRDRLDTLQQGWLESRRHFPDGCFGALAALDDNLIRPHTGFNTHPDADTTLVYYVADGTLTHGDSLNNHIMLHRGEAACLLAGDGVRHSELNQGNTPLHLIRLVFSVPTHTQPRFARIQPLWAARAGRWLPLVSDSVRDGQTLSVDADASVLVTDLPDERHLAFPIEPARQVYLLVLAGAAEINGLVLEAGDALSGFGETLQITALSRAHLLLIETAQGTPG